jgi:hypothetical protein
MEEKYKKFELMIHKAVHTTAEKFPDVCKEELLCEGNYCFMEALESHDASLGSFSTWLHQKLYGRLHNFAARGAWLQKKEGAEMPEIPVKVGGTQQDLLGRLGEDARVAAEIALTAPEDMSVALLREILKDMGWVERRMRRCFNEIREVI